MSKVTKKSDVPLTKVTRVRLIEDAVQICGEKDVPSRAPTSWTDQIRVTTQGRTLLNCATMSILRVA
jgi:hypothetical protein